MNKLKISIIFLIILKVSLNNADKPFLVGGYIPIAVNDNQLVKCTDHAIEQINFSTNNSLGDNYFQKEKILYAMRQIVAGINYKVTFLLSETNCNKNELTLNECLSKNLAANQAFSNNRRVCYVRIHQSLPEQDTNMTKFIIFESNCY